MKRKIIAILVANLFAGSAAVYAQETGLKWTGDVSLGLRGTHVNASDKSKFREYRDLDRASPITVLDARGESQTHRFNIFGENIGQDDQYIDVRGTQFGVWKFRLYDNEVRHRFGSGPGAKSPYSGIGSPVLTAAPPFPRLNNNTWNFFDDSLERRDLGAMAEWSGYSPWYFRFDGNQVTRKGIKVIGGPQSTSPGGGNVDLPSPVDWTTRNLSGEAGYQGSNRHFAVSFLHSKFENDNDLLRWSNGFFAPAAPTNYDTSVLPADNTLWRLGVNGNWRGLPWGSTVAGRVTYSKLTNDVAVLPTMLSTSPALPAPQVGTNPTTGANAPIFSGEIVNTTASFTLNSHPTRALDTKLYYNFREKENNSTRMLFVAPALGCAAPGCVPELFDYEKHSAGLEGFYRVNRENRLGAGYDYYHTKRQRLDFPKTIDQKVFAEWKSSALDVVDTRLKYQYLHRSSVAFPYADPGNPIDTYVRRFDFANVNQHLAKLSFDANPMPLVDVSFDVIYKQNDFRDTPLGRTKDRRQEYYASVGYGNPNSFRVLVFADVEFFDADSRHRVGGGGANPDGPPAPPPPAVSTTYTWTADNKDKSWQTGIAVDWVPLARIKVNGSLVWAQTRGTVDFAAQPGTVLAAPFLPIRAFDNTRRIALNLKSTYMHDKQWHFTGGYAFERYAYNDIGYDGFRYVIPAGAAPTLPSTSYFSGQGAFQPHNAHIAYVYATYRFGR